MSASYIANAIELIGFGTPRPLLDVNMARVLERYFVQEISPTLGMIHTCRIWLRVSWSVRSHYRSIGRFSTSVRWSVLPDHHSVQCVPYVLDVNAQEVSAVQGTTSSS